MGKWFDGFEVKEDHTQWTVQMIQIKILPGEKNNKKVLKTKFFEEKLFFWDCQKISRLNGLLIDFKDYKIDWGLGLVKGWGSRAESWIFKFPY